MSKWTWGGSGTLFLVLLMGCASPKPLPTSRRDADLAQMTRIARAAFERGSIPQAIALYERALKRARMLDEATEIGNAAYNLAVCLTMTGQYDRARELLREAASEFRRAKQNLADVWLLEAKVVYKQGQRAEALSLAERVLTDPASTPSRSHRVQVAVLQGNIAFDDGDAALAKRALARAQQEMQAVSNYALQAETVRLAGSIDLLEEKTDAAAVAFDREAGLWQQAGRYPEMARALGRAGKAYRAAGRKGSGAERFFRAARSSWARGEREVALYYIQEAASLAQETPNLSLRQRVLTLQEEMLNTGGAGSP